MSNIFRRSLSWSSHTLRRVSSKFVSSKATPYDDAIVDEATEEIEKIKPHVDDLLQQLKHFDDYNSSEAATVLTSLADFSENYLQENAKDHEGNDEPGPIFTTPEYVHHCQIVGRYLLQEGYVELFVKIGNSLKHHVCGGSRHEYQGWENFGLLCWGMINYAEFSPEIGHLLAESGGIDILFQALDFLQKDVSRRKSDISTFKMQLLVLCLVFHCRHDNREKYREANAVEVLTKFLKSKDLSRKTYALLTLAGVISDRQNELLKAKDCIGFLVQLLEQGMDSPNHTADFKDEEGILVAISVRDILDGLNCLAVNDDNKTVVDDLGGTALANKVQQADFTDDEKTFAADILWALAFNDEIKKGVTFQNARDSESRLLQTLIMYCVLKIVCALLQTYFDNLFGIHQYRLVGHSFTALLKTITSCKVVKVAQI